jgi:hypothetical protein
VFLAQAESLCAIGGREDAEPTAFERSLQKVSKVAVVFDQQNGDRRLPRRREVKPLAW